MNFILNRFFTLTKGWLLVIMVLCTIDLVAQDPIYSQFYNSPILINPANAGNTKGALVAVQYRNQWPSIDNAYTTYSVTYDQRWNKKSGVGLYVNTDNAGNGALKTTKLAGIYSYRLRVQDDIFVKGAIEAGYGQTRLDKDQLVFLDNLDPQYGRVAPGGITFPTSEVLSDSPSRSYFDVGSGVMLYSPFYYVGMSFKHMNTPNIDFIDDVTGETGILPMRFSAHGGLQINLDDHNNTDEGTFISPNLLFVKQGAFWQVNLGTYINFSQMFAGVWYRHAHSNSDAIIGSIGVRSGIFKISYSFDYTISGLTIGSGGSHEIGIALNFDKLLPKKQDYNDCLMLFR